MNYRGYLIKSSERSPMMYAVSTEGQGGKIPDVLKGVFTHTSVVTSIIDRYLDNEKGKVNGKTTTKGGD